MNVTPRPMWAIYLPPNMFPHIDGKYTVNLYDTKEEAEADLPRVQRKWGQSAFIEKRDVS